jgi:hypothetical protein
VTHSGEWRKILEDVMATFKSLTIVAVLLAGGPSLAIAQNGLPTGDQSPVAGGANGGQWGWYAGSVYGYSANRFEYYPSYGYEQYPAYGYGYGNRY